MVENKRTVNGKYGDDRFSVEEAKLFRQPDVLCVEDYLHVYRAKPAETPERRLLAAILRDAIDCYIRACCAQNRHKKRSFREVEEWFFRADDSGVFSFVNICEVLRIDPGYIRRGLLRYEQQSSSPAKSRTSALAGDRAKSDLRMAS
jgi:hypothetical protein